MLIYAIISINLALLFYTIGVWSEKKQGELKTWHVAIFWVGLLFDTLGTSLMSKLTNSTFKFNFHGITGAVAILLMMFHAIWASVVLYKNNKQLKIKFHKFSIFVWIIWLIPFLSGLIFGVTR